jgi:glycolate oxidase iron-sulfur subunit
MSEPTLKLRAAVLADADLCVKCGLCLPHCPTYRLSQSEADSPRGRIALAQGLARGQLLPDSSVKGHLDACLSCRACEVVCPAKVPYGRVLDGSRALLATPARTASTRLVAALLLPRFLRALLRAGLWLLSRLPAVLLQRLPRLVRAAPVATRFRAPTIAAKGRVALFAGCVGDLAERQVLDDAALLLTACGLDPYLPAAQTCCGALHQHAGLPAAAAVLAAHNQTALQAAEVVLTLTPGCGAALKDLNPALAVQDLCAYLAAQLQRCHLPLAATSLRIGVHSACTQKNVLKAGNAVVDLLQLIPGISLLPLAPESGCCGAAGTQFLSHPVQADALLVPKLAAASAQQVAVIASANIGCSLHLLAGLRQQKSSVQVRHPVSLVADAYRQSGNKSVTRDALYRLRDRGKP